MALKNLETLKDFEDLIAEDKVTIVDFTATWCPPCQRIAPWFKENAEKDEYKHINFAKCDVDANKETSEKAGVNCMPTFKIYKKNVLINTIEGADKDTIEKMFKLDDQKIAEMAKKQEKAKKDADEMAKLLPMCKDKDTYDAHAAQDKLTIIYFYIEDYNEETTNLTEALTQAVRDTETCPEINSDNVMRCNLAEHGQLGNATRVSSLPCLRIHYNNKVVEVVTTNNIDRVKEIMKMSKEDVEAIVKKNEEDLNRLKALVPQIDEEDKYMEAIKNDDCYTLIDYYATWCGPCINFAPTLCQMADDYQKEGKNIKVYKIDCDINTKAKAHGEVKCFPTFKFWKGGKMLGECSGANKDTLNTMIEGCMKEKSEDNVDEKKTEEET